MLEENKTPIVYFGLHLTVAEAKKFLCENRFFAGKGDREYILKKLEELAEDQSNETKNRK